MDTARIRDELLAVMDGKHHWAYPAFTRPGLSRAELKVHFQHEYGVYVRDFPILLARALGQVPDVPDVRRSLAENLYEEQTGGLSGTAPHPELFLRMMEGLGYVRDAFDASAVERDLHPTAASYAAWLRERSAAPPWQAAVALLTIFVEGSVHERAELAGTHVRPRGQAAVERHALVVHYGCPTEAMTLVRAHGDVEGDHRAAAWSMVLGHLESDAVAASVVGVVREAAERWQRYRDAVAERMGLTAERVSRGAAA